MIARIWRWLFSACSHEWETIKTGTWGEVDPFTKKVLSNGHYYDCRCKKCGKIKMFRT